MTPSDESVEQVDEVDPLGAAPDLNDEDSDVLGEEVAADLDELAKVSAERDEYLALAQRLQAEFENFRKRTLKERSEAEANGAARLAERLLPVLDACDNAIVHGVEGVTPIYKVLFEALSKDGLTVIDADDAPFDPNLHEAVIHEPGDGSDPRVIESLRTGYLWHDRVLRPAMVKVRG